MQPITSKNILEDLKELREKLDSLIETLEITSDEELMESIKRAKEQPVKRKFEELLEELDVDV